MFTQGTNPWTDHKRGNLRLKRFPQMMSMMITLATHIETEKKQPTVKKGDCDLPIAGLSPQVQHLIDDLDTLCDAKTLRVRSKLKHSVFLNPKNTDRDVWALLLCGINNSFYKTIQHMYLMTKKYGYSFASDAYLSRKLGVHAKTIARHRTLARAIGLIDWDLRLNNDQRRSNYINLKLKSANRRTSIYHFCDDLKKHDGIYNLRDWAFDLENRRKLHGHCDDDFDDDFAPHLEADISCAPDCDTDCAPLVTKRLKEHNRSYKRDTGFSEKKEKAAKESRVFLPPDEGPPEKCSGETPRIDQKTRPSETTRVGRSAADASVDSATQEKVATQPRKSPSKAFCASRMKNTLDGLPSCLDLTSPKAIEYCREKKLDKTRAREVLLKDAAKQEMLMKDGILEAQDAATLDVMRYWLRWVSPEQLFFIISHDFVAYSKKHKVFSRNLLIQSMIKTFILNKHKSYERWKGVVAKSADQEKGVCSGLKKEVDETSTNNFNEMAENHKFAMQKLRGIAGVRYSNSTNMFILPNFHIARLTLDDPMFKAKVLDFVRKNKTSAQKS